MTIPRILHPLFDRAAQPDSPHDAPLEATLAQQTQTLAFMGSLATRCWNWPRHDNLYGGITRHDCPKAYVSAIDTWTDFSIGWEDSLDDYEPYCTYELPWLLTVSVENVLAICQIAARQSARVDFRVNASTLIDACSSDSGFVTNYNKLVSEHPQAIGWRDSEKPFFYTTMTSHVKVTSPPANRRIKLTPQVRISEDVNFDFDNGEIVALFMMGMQIMDILPEEEGVI